MLLFFNNTSMSRLVKGWCNVINLKGNYASHTLRKTWGYHQRVTFNVGITISSRSGVEREMKDMINFVSEVERAGLVWLIKEVFYDSNGNICDITFADEDATVWWQKKLRYIAENTLEQHSVFGGSGGYLFQDERHPGFNEKVKTDRNSKNQKYFWLNDPFPYTPAEKVKSIKRILSRSGLILLNLMEKECSK
ncbi:MAG: hypothetical protein QNK40_14125 [Desulfobacterales bacterium]|nr:hypothetical protein [Desulfobacterales bacterium]